MCARSVIGKNIEEVEVQMLGAVAADMTRVVTRELEGLGEEGMLVLVLCMAGEGGKEPESSVDLRPLRLVAVGEVTWKVVCSVCLGVMGLM